MHLYVMNIHNIFGQPDDVGQALRMFPFFKLTNSHEFLTLTMNMKWLTNWSHKLDPQICLDKNIFGQLQKWNIPEFGNILKCSSFKMGSGFWLSPKNIYEL